jgi:putative transcriptional regulator
MNDLVPLVKLTELREAKGLTQTQLAKKAMISRPLLANIERGYANPSLKTANKIAGALESTIDEIFFTRKVRKSNKSA